MDPPACVLPTDSSSMVLPRGITLLRYTLRPTFSGILCPPGTHTVFWKANVRMLLQFAALRSLQPALHFRRRRARAKQTAWSWHPSRGYDSRPVVESSQSGDVLLVL